MQGQRNNDIFSKTKYRDEKHHANTFLNYMTISDWYMAET